MLDFFSGGNPVKEVLYKFFFFRIGSWKNTIFFLISTIFLPLPRINHPHTSHEVAKNDIKQICVRAVPKGWTDLSYRKSFSLVWNEQAFWAFDIKRWGWNWFYGVYSGHSISLRYYRKIYTQGKKTPLKMKSGINLITLIAL